MGYIHDTCMYTSMHTCTQQINLKVRCIPWQFKVQEIQHVSTVLYHYLEGNVTTGTLVIHTYMTYHTYNVICNKYHMYVIHVHVHS